jgi:hypothetical protein
MSDFALPVGSKGLGLYFAMVDAPEYFALAGFLLVEGVMDGYFAISLLTLCNP